MRSRPMLKCCSERCVCAPQSLSAGTETSPRLSLSMRNSVIPTSNARIFAAGSSSPALGHHSLGIGDCARRVEAFRAGAGAVHNRVAAIEAERVLEPVEALAGTLIAAVGEPTIGLQQDRRA